MAHGRRQVRLLQLDDAPRLHCSGRLLASEIHHPAHPTVASDTASVWAVANNFVKNNGWLGWVK